MLFIANATSSSTVEWLNTLLAAVALAVGIVALIQTARANRTANAANQLSGGANEIAKGANVIAERALSHQLDDAIARVRVIPRIATLVGHRETEGPLPIVEVVNLSSFAITISNVWWRVKPGDGDGHALIWVRPKVSSPHQSLPARLEARDSLTLMGSTESLQDLAVVRGIIAAVVQTASGEAFEGMSETWKSSLDKLEAERRAKR